MSQPVFPPGLPARPTFTPSQVSAPPPESSASPSPSLEQIVRVAYEQGHSDVHLGIGESPRFRARGEIIRSDWPPTEPSEFQDWLGELLTPQQIDHFRQCKEFDGAHAFSFVRVRINLLDALKGAAMVLRLIPQKILSLDDLKLPHVLQELCAHPKGLLLVTGPTGSGKSTTLAAMIDWINRNQSRHILTIEDPIEFVHESRKSLIRQREVGRHTLHFYHALRAALREDPDVILVGEIRDKESIAIAMEAAQTGHLVFGTLHTSSAVKTVERVIGMYRTEDQENIRNSLAESLMGIVSQGLVQNIGGKRTAYHDLMINTDACKDYIQKGALDDVEDIMQRSEFDGMMTANQSLQKLVESGQVEAEKAIDVSPRPNELTQALRGRS
jgi:twitching motility protein PilT